MSGSEAFVGFIGGLFGALIFAFIPIWIVHLSPLKKYPAAYLVSLVLAGLLAASTALGQARPSGLDWLKVIIAIGIAIWFVTKKMKKPSI
jgi:hypothetical protein